MPSSASPRSWGSAPPPGSPPGSCSSRVLRATPRIADDLQSVGIVAAAVLVGAGTASIHGSGFLAVYITGLLVADTWKVQDGSYHVAANAASAVAEPVIFGLLGAAFASQVGWDELGLRDRADRGDGVPRAPDRRRGGNGRQRAHQGRARPRRRGAA